MYIFAEFIQKRRCASLAVTALPLCDGADAGHWAVSVARWAEPASRTALCWV